MTRVQAAFASSEPTTSPDSVEYSTEPTTEDKQDEDKKFSLRYAPESPVISLRKRAKHISIHSHDPSYKRYPPRDQGEAVSHGPSSAVTARWDLHRPTVSTRADLGSVQAPASFSPTASSSVKTVATTEHDPASPQSQLETAIPAPRSLGSVVLHSSDPSLLQPSSAMLPPTRKKSKLIQDYSDPTAALERIDAALAPAVVVRPYVLPDPVELRKETIQAQRALIVPASPVLSAEQLAPKERELQEQLEACLIASSRQNHPDAEDTEFEEINPRDTSSTHHSLKSFRVRRQQPDAAQQRGYQPQPHQPRMFRPPTAPVVSLPSRVAHPITRARRPPANKPRVKRLAISKSARLIQSRNNSRAELKKANKPNTSPDRYIYVLSCFYLHVYMYSSTLLFK